MNKLYNSDLRSEIGDFDEGAYLTRYPRIADAVKAGRFSYGLDHYLRHGRAEGRDPGPLGGRLLPDEISPETSGIDFHRRNNGPLGFAPTDLTLHELHPGRVAMTGSCLMENWGFHKTNPSNAVVDIFLANNMSSTPAWSPDLEGKYDFVLVQIPLRNILQDSVIYSLAYNDVDGHFQVLERAKANLAAQLRARMNWNRESGLLTFVTNFLVPQKNPNGCLFPKFDVRNPQYMISELNRHLEDLVRECKNAHVVDIDQIAASMGKFGLQDDSIWAFSHGSLLPYALPPNPRIEPMQPLVEYHTFPRNYSFAEALWAELLLMFRTIRQTDAVKLVVVDLDDTLWKGVSGEMDDLDPMMTEGWPLGFAEALMFLKRRGVLLAISSKNEESRIREIWPKLFGRRLALEDFAVVAINWRPKPENMQEILETVNLLPRSVLFIDDNPVERAGMLRAFPDMRVLGRHPYYLRRILLWSSETQVPEVTRESARRTEMVQAQVERESQRKVMTRAEFLAQAAPAVTLFEVDSTRHPRFGRCLELVNKTNQFNTTGGRLTTEAADALFRAGGRFHAFEVTDAYTSYGLVGVVVVRGHAIEQWVMSCRVLGYDIEVAVMARIVEMLRAAGADAVTGALVTTDANFPCRDLFAKTGFKVAGEGGWRLDASATVAAPAHVAVLPGANPSTVKP